MIFSTHTLHDFFTIQIDNENSVQVRITAINEDGSVELMIEAADESIIDISQHLPTESP